MTTKKVLYHSYLLRLWCEVENELPTWRASAESVQSGQCWGFVNLQELLIFLSTQTVTAQETLKQPVKRTMGQVKGAQASKRQTRETTPLYHITIQTESK